MNKEFFTCEICNNEFPISDLEIAEQVYADGETVNTYEVCGGCLPEAYDRLGIVYFDGDEWRNEK